MIPWVGPGMIGIPCGDNLRTSDILPSIWALQRPTGTVFKKASGLGPAKPLNEIGRAFMANPGLEWLFLTNDDNVLPPNALMKLLSHNVDVVSGLYLGKVLPFQPIALWKTDRDSEFTYQRLNFTDIQSPAPLQQVDAVGDGCLLIRRRVMVDLSHLSVEPWHYRGSDECDHDISFCRSVQGFGHKIWLDSTVRVGHTATFNVVPHLNEKGEWEIHLQQGGDGRTIVLPGTLT